MRRSGLGLTTYHTVRAFASLNVDATAATARIIGTREHGDFFLWGKVEKCVDVFSVVVVVRVKKINPVKGAFLGLKLAVSERSRKGKKYNKKEVSKAPETMNSNEGETEGRVKKNSK